ncbi:MAG TPA: nucleotidyltransferase family protein, partial [Thermoanaerobaculia bacterium]|nr:nucleotidyltransferase family protein [Thermoanaerobaculia bacterium]
ARLGRSRLAAELGSEAAAGFQRDLLATVAQGLRLEALLMDVAAVAAERSIPLVLLKYAALEASGVLAPGARAACDLDLMAPPERAGELQEALVARGFRASGLPDSEHQLPALIHPAGGLLEVHRLVLGVRPDGAGSATVATLERAGMLTPVVDLPGCFLPAREVQMAHVLVHGIGQHGFWPDSYPLLRTLSDLADLGFHDEAAAPLARRAARLVARDVSAEESEAARELCAALVAGEDLTPHPPLPSHSHSPGEGAPPPERHDLESDGGSPSPGWGERDGRGGQGVRSPGARLLLLHILAGRLAPDYASALRLSLFRAQPSDRRPAVRLVHSVLDAVFLSRAQIDAIYGRPRHPLGYLGRRLARPFDLLLRLGTYGARTFRLRERS